MSQKPLIVFLHIPKTGGSTIGRYLETAYGERYALLQGSAQMNAVADWSQYDAIAGHFTAADVCAIPRETRVFTVLRHPVDRLASLYRWWHDHDRDNPMEAIRAVQRMTLDEFIEHRDYWKHTVNGMTMQCAETKRSDDYFDSMNFVEATDFLDSCELVGTFDHYGTFVERMARLLDWTFPVGGVHEKQVGGVIEVDAATRRRIILDNPLDVALYVYAEMLLGV